MRSLVPQRFHDALYIFAIALLIIGLPVSKFLMSVSQIILVMNWILEGDLKNKLRAFVRNKPAVILSSLLLMHVLSLLYTSNMAYGLKDIRIKLPLFILPLIFSTSKPITQKTVDLLLQLFLGTVFVATIISTLILTDTLIHRRIVDIRDTSIFISHIRFGLLVCLSVFITVYFFLKTKAVLLKVTYVIFICWLIYFLVLMELLTGLSAVIITAAILIVLHLFRSSKPLMKWGGLALFLSISALGVYVYTLNNIHTIVAPPIAERILTRTVEGNLYQHDTSNHQTENGHLVWINFQKEEVERSWNIRSKIPFDSKDLKGNGLQFTLIRFLTSKGLNKDATGVNTLTSNEIKAIERGVANADYQNISSLRGRIHGIFWEIDAYNRTGDANGHSLVQRYEYWKTALAIIKQDPWIGIGSGDVQDAFNTQYELNKSVLLPERRLHSHNQYLSIAVGMGLIGLAWFLITLCYPLYAFQLQNNFLYMSFFIIVLLSFFTEDTLETQAGVTFYTFFNCFFLFLLPRFKEEE